MIYTFLSPNVVFTFIIINFTILFVASLKLNLRPSRTLTDLSTIHGTDFINLTQELFNNDRYWRILADLNRSGSFDFSSTLMQSIAQIECSDFLESIQIVGFPRKEVLTSDLIARNPKCFRAVPDQLLAMLLPNNPMESRFFQASEWNINHIQTFLLRESQPSALTRVDNNNIKMRWNSWCSELSVEFLLTYQNEWKRIFWKKLNVFGIEELGIKNKQAAVLSLSYISPIENLMTFSTTSARSISKSILKFSSKLFKFNPPLSTSRSYSDHQENFAKEQIRKVLLISAYLKAYQGSSSADLKEIYSLALSILSSYLNLLVQCQNNQEKKFPLRRDLIEFTRILLSEQDGHDYSTYLKADFEECLVKFVDFVDFDSNAILNALFLWKSKNYSNGAEFEDEMVRKFFDVKSGATIENACDLLQYFKSNHYNDSKHIKLVKLHSYLSQRKDLAIGVLNTCPMHIPSQSKKSDSMIPLKDRYNFSLKSSRVIYGIWGFQVIVSPVPSIFCISVMKELLAYMSDWVNYLYILPLNIIVYYQIVHEEDLEIVTFIYGNIRTLLESFFKNLIKTPKWFLTTGFANSMTEGEGPRPIIYPNISFPPQLMELIGVLLGKSSILPGFRVPFLLDRNYFVKSEKEALNSVYFPQFHLDGPIMNQIQFDSIKKRLQHSLYEVITKFNELGEFVYDSDYNANKEELNDNDSVCSDTSDRRIKKQDTTLLKIHAQTDTSDEEVHEKKEYSIDSITEKIISDTVAMGRARLWSGLESSIETNFLSKEHVYESIFYNNK